MDTYMDRLMKRVEEESNNQFIKKKAELDEKSKSALAELKVVQNKKRLAREMDKSESSSDDEAKKTFSPVKDNQQEQPSDKKADAEAGQITAKALSGIGAIRKREGAKVVTDKPNATSREKETRMQKIYGWDFGNTSFYNNVTVPTNLSRAAKGQFEKVINISKRVDKYPDDMTAWNDLRNAIAAIEFFPDISHALVKATGMLKPGKGLVYIIENSNSHFPPDIVNDALALYRRWKTGDIDPNPFRGIDIATGKLKDMSLDVIDTDKLIAPKIVIGQWWPMFICLVRDRVHMASMAGIAGNKEGAQSIVLSGGKASEDYYDVDNGDIIQYSGTLSPDDTTRNTNLMRQIVGKVHHSVRVFRNHTLRSDYAPKVGIRYDGLYTVTKEKNVDAKTNHWVFTLQRLSRQEPIRSANIDAELARPSQAEIDAFEKYNSIKQALKAKSTGS